MLVCPARWSPRIARNGLPPRITEPDASAGISRRVRDAKLSFMAYGCVDIVRGFDDPPPVNAFLIPLPMFLISSITPAIMSLTHVKKPDKNAFIESTTPSILVLKIVKISCAVFHAPFQSPSISCLTTFTNRRNTVFMMSIILFILFQKSLNVSQATAHASFQNSKQSFINVIKVVKPSTIVLIPSIINSNSTPNPCTKNGTA